MGPFAQIMHAAVEQGIAEAALADTFDFVRTSARPWKDAGVDRASDDPYTSPRSARLKIRVDASSALLDRAGKFVDRAAAEPTIETVAAASVAVAEAKIASTDAALLVSSQADRTRRARAPRSPNSTSIAIGATRAPIRSMIRSAGNTAPSATIG
jgi:alkylation response protein AidB-like acyl-CoA dehydrogenase